MRRPTMRDEQLPLPYLPDGRAIGQIGGTDAR